MSEDRTITEERRRFLKLVSGSAVLVPVMGITACSGGSDDAPPAAPKADAAPAAATSGMPRISEDDPQAKSLAYVHEASSIDATKQPRYKAGQLCSNCALYQGKAGSEWAGCSIFPGKAVKASGWCSVYAPKPS
ncbi:MAG: high-potential iron-sulfur protein [Woeseiaceae bacterium]